MAASTAARRATRKRAELLVLDRDDEPEDAKGLPLFADQDGDITGITIWRLEPVNEGHLGQLPPDADEEAIRRQWGGGVFKVSAKGADGRFRHTRTVTVSGDPKLESADARRRYRNKMRGLDEIDDPKPEVPPAPSSGAAETLTIMTQAHNQQLQLLRMQMEAARQDARDREDRQRREWEEARSRERESMAMILSIVKKDNAAAGAASSPTAMVDVLLQGLKMGRAFAGSGEQGPSDPLTAFINALPTVLEQGKALLAPGAGPQPAAAPGAPPAITLSGAIAERLRNHVRTLQGKGYSPKQALDLAEQAIALGVDQLASVPNAPPVAAAPPAAAPPAEPPPATAEPAHATPEVIAPRPVQRAANRAHHRR